MKSRVCASIPMIACAAALLGSPLSTFAAPDQPATQPTSVTTQPQATTESNLVYEVYEVAGGVFVAPIGADPIKDAAQWRQVKVGEALGRGQQLRTALRAKVKLVARPADPPTVIMIENSSRLSIEELAIKDGRAVSRLALGYGAIRAGVAEGTVRSDMEIASPQAVLSKKGTDIFRIEYMNGKYTMSLSEQGRGILQAIQFQFSQRGDILGSKSRFVTPGQQVNQRMAQAIESMTWDRDINLNDVFGLVGNDRLFTLLNDRGFGFLLPFNSALSRANGNTPNPNDNANALANMLPLTTNSGVRQIRDGDFGVGQGTLPNLFTAFSRRKLNDARTRNANSFRALAKQQTRQRFTFGRQR